jgi:hypothetical protein
VKPDWKCSLRAVLLIAALVGLAAGRAAPLKPRDVVPLWPEIAPGSAQVQISE